MIPAASSTQTLRALLATDACWVMPCCYDGLSARLIERAGFKLTFMSGFAVAAARIAAPDTGLLSVNEMLDQGRSIVEATRLPIIGDGDTGHGNVANVARTVESFARAGFAGIMIEDQLAPKRCGHTRGKDVVDRHESLARIRAAVRARESGADILIMARTDARGTHGMDEALWRMAAFRDLGADILFLEAPQSRQEMETFCQQIEGPKMANMLEEGLTPILPPETLQAIGYRIAAYPLTLIGSAIQAMQEALSALSEGRTPERRTPFPEILEIVGFNDHDQFLNEVREDVAGKDY